MDDEDIYMVETESGSSPAVETSDSNFTRKTIANNRMFTTKTRKNTKYFILTHTKNDSWNIQNVMNICLSGSKYSKLIKAIATNSPSHKNSSYIQKLYEQAPEWKLSNIMVIIFKEDVNNEEIVHWLKSRFHNTNVTVVDVNFVFL